MSHQNNPETLGFDNSEQRRTSHIMLDLIQGNTGATISLRQILNKLGERSFGFILVIVTVVSFIPFVSVLTGIILCLIGVQMFMGLQCVEVPKQILDRKMSSIKVNKAFEVVIPRIQFLEQYIRPRWHQINSTVIERLNGLVVVVLGLINAIPIPLTNVAPAILIMILAIGLIEKDGLVQFLSLTCSLFFAALIVFLLFF